MLSACQKLQESFNSLPVNGKKFSGLSALPLAVV
jgi:hypothetical protein